jgi:hypothetical protein
MTDIFQLRFTITEIVSLLGLSQALYIVVYILFRTKHMVREGLPLTYFLVLTIALFLDLGSRFIGGSVYYPILQWFFWFCGPPLSVLLVHQIAFINSSPPLNKYRILFLVPVAFGISFWFASFDESCSTILSCPSFSKILVVSGVIVGAFSFFELWSGRKGILKGVTIKKNGKERYWLIIMLVLMNVVFLAMMLFEVDEFYGGKAPMIRGVLAISLSYLAGTKSWSCLVRQFGGEVKVDSYFTDHAASA